VSSASADRWGDRSRKSGASSGISLVARDTEFAIIWEHIAGKKSLHIYGDEGVGKSALLDEVYDSLKERRTPVPIYCRSSRTLRSILLELSLFLLSHFSHLESVDKFKRVKEIHCGPDIKKLSIRALRNIVYSYVPLAEFCVLLDHLEYVTPRINSFLSVLYERATLITASRQSWELKDYSFRGRLDYCLYLTPKLKVENLSRTDAFLLMKNLTQGALEADEGLFDEVYRIAKGNAGLTKEIIAKALMSQYRTAGHPNLGLVQLDIAIEKAKT
jgi:hypothetical protein